MSITIEGVKISNIEVVRDSDGKLKLTGDYHILSNEGIVLAKQGFNGYSEVEVPYSKSTMDTLNYLMLSVKDDVESSLGLIKKGAANV